MYSIETQGEVQILKIDDLWNPLENQKLVETIAGLIEEGKKHYILDFSHLPFMNSNGLSFLISILTRVRSAGGELVLAHISDKIQQMLLMTRLQQMFNLADNVDAAMQYFHDKGVE